MTAAGRPDYDSAIRIRSIPADEPMFVLRALREGSAGRTGDLPDLNLAYSALVVGYLEALKQSLLLWREAA